MALTVRVVTGRLPVQYRVDDPEVLVARRRLPHDDFVCLRCGCPCDPQGSRHLGGGPGMRACGRRPAPVLRAELDADMAAVVAAVRHAL